MKLAAAMHPTPQLMIWREPWLRRDRRRRCTILRVVSSIERDPRLTFGSPPGCDPRVGRQPPLNRVTLTVEAQTDRPFDLPGRQPGRALGASPDRNCADATHHDPDE